MGWYPQIIPNLDHFSESHGSHGDLVPHDLRNPPILQGGAPQVISWFIIPLTIVISTINHSY